MRNVTLLSSARAEWIKFRSVRSTLIGVLTMFALTVGLGSLIDLLVANRYSTMSAQSRLGFDPLSASLVGVFLAEFVVGVIGAMFITSEYTSSSIRTTLLAVPRRVMLVGSKALVMLGALVVTSEAAVILSFLIGQGILHSGAAPSYSLASPGALRAVLLAGLYLSLLGAMGFALGLITRRTTSAIVVFVVALLILPLITIFLPTDIGGPIRRYLPSELGTGMMSINQAPGTFGPYACAIVLACYVAALAVIGTVLFSRRDA